MPALHEADPAHTDSTTDLDDSQAGVLSHLTKSRSAAASGKTSYVFIAVVERGYDQRLSSRSLLTVFMFQAALDPNKISG